MSAPQNCIVHPLVLLSILDHYKRASLSAGKRVVGVLLGHTAGRRVHITNSYAVPFEEVDSESTVWYLDWDYHVNMMELSKKINASERPVGWYHSGPKLRANDLDINELFRRSASTSHPMLAVLDVQSVSGISSNKPNADGMEGQGMNSESPLRTYVAVDEIGDDGQLVGRSWAHLPSTVEADEAEEVGIEHLMRQDYSYADLMSSSEQQQSPDPSSQSSTARRSRRCPPAVVDSKKTALQALDRQLANLDQYLGHVLAHQLPTNHGVLANVQDVFNMLPPFTSEGFVQTAIDESQCAALTVDTNDQMVSIQLASMARSVIALHNLVNNRLAAAAAAAVSSSNT